MVGWAAFCLRQVYPLSDLLNRQWRLIREHSFMAVNCQLPPYPTFLPPPPALPPALLATRGLPFYVCFRRCERAWGSFFFKAQAYVRYLLRTPRCRGGHHRGHATGRGLPGAHTFPGILGLFPDGNRPSIKRRECLTPQVLKATFMG